MRINSKTFFIMGAALSCIVAATLGFLIGQWKRPSVRYLQPAPVLLSVAEDLRETAGHAETVYFIDNYINHMIVDASASGSYEDLTLADQRELQFVKKYRQKYPLEPREYPWDEKLAKSVQAFLQQLPDLPERPPPNPSRLGPDGYLPSLAHGYASCVLRLTCQDEQSGVSITNIGVTNIGVTNSLAVQFVHMISSPEHPESIDYRFVILCGFSTYYRDGHYTHESEIASLNLSFKIVSPGYQAEVLHIASTNFASTNLLSRIVRMKKREG